MIPRSLIATTARALLDEHQARHPYHPLADDLRAAPLEDAYAIQEAFQQLRMMESSGPIVGYKIALTSKAMQQMCGVDRPLAGAIFASVVHASPARLSLGGFQHLGVEFEVAVKLGADLPSAAKPHTRASVASAVAACMAAYELVEDRHADYQRMDAFSLVADNCWNGGIVLGAPVENWRTLDLVQAPTQLWINGLFAGQGKIGDALGHPFEAVAWLANLLNQQGKMLKTGMIIMTGSSITTKFPSAGDRLRFEIEGLGGVELELTA
ncbi:MAG: fumarylacetoacetate hydrolase family protein [Gammaproteobacteria bacterium]